MDYESLVFVDMMRFTIKIPDLELVYRMSLHKTNDALMRFHRDFCGK